MTGAKKIIVSIAVVLVVVVAAVVKLIFFPSVKDAWFQFSAQKLRQIPGGIVVVRPTHFPKSLHKGIIVTGMNGTRRMLGRNITLAQLMAAAYDYNPARVVLPPDAPTNNFDFLVTVPSGPDEHLQLAIRKKINFVAHPETRDADVLVLKIVDVGLPGLTVSDTGEKQNVIFQNRRINFTHTSLAAITGGLEHMLNAPVVDKLGLTNFYDYSMAWTEQTQRQMRNGTMTREAANKILASWGLGLQADTASIKMLVVEKAGD
jgi:uncharacterized protein (TIGR03435 family)